MKTIARGVGWVAAENLHVTLKFLGQVDAARIDDVNAALDRAVRDTRAFDLTVTGLGAFPTASRPRVVWAGLREGGDALAALAARVDDELEPLGFAREARPFSPHVTIGRVREPKRDPRLEAALVEGAAAPFGRVRVDRACLMRSDLSPRGARYTVLAAHPLR